MEKTKHTHENPTSFSGTHLESTLPPKQTHKAGQDAGNLLGYFLGHLATFQFDHFHFLTHCEEWGRSFSWSSPTRYIHRSLLGYFNGYSTSSSLIGHQQIASPQLIGNLITINFTTFKPISGLQTLIKAMHAFETSLLSHFFLYKIYIIFLIKKQKTKKPTNIDIISYAISSSCGTVWSYQPAFREEASFRFSVHSWFAGPESGHVARSSNNKFIKSHDLRKIKGSCITISDWVFLFF